MVTDILESETPAVFVSLPANDVEMARRAVDAGADGLKVHLNVTHRASGTDFGSVAEEADSIHEIGALDVPLGVVPGEDPETIRETVPELAGLPVDFVDGFAHHLPPEATEVPGLATLVAPTGEDSDDEVLRLDRLDVDGIELSLQTTASYGDPLTVDAAARYVDLADRIAKPVMLPTQLALRPTDAAYLADRGVSNFLVGTVVMDATPEGVAETTAAFVEALA